MKADCDGNCTNCNETELPNIKDKDCQSIGYSYAYKTDCAGDRYIKAEEVKYLLKCERNKAIDDFVERLNEKCDAMIKEKWNSNVAPISWAEAYSDFKDDIDEVVGRLKEGGENEQSI